MFKRLIAGILSVTMCAATITSGNTGPFVYSDGQSDDSSDFSLKETADDNNSSDMITDKPEIQQKPVCHSVPDDSEIYESVSLGKNIHGDVYSNGLLRIYGYGKMENFYASPFVNHAAITQILFEDTDAQNGLVISNIGKNVFKGMSQLHSSSYQDITKAESGVFVFPEHITAIEETAFAYCSGLVKMIIPESVTSMGTNMFYGCTSLEELTIPFASVNNYSGYNNSVRDLFISNLLDFDGSDADFSNYSIRKIIVTGGSEIRDHAFSFMTTLREVDFSNTEISFVGHNAFSNCTKLENVKIPETLTALGNSSFRNTSITSLPDNGHITSIGNYAFYGCKNLSCTTVPKTCQTIGKGAFINCTGIKKLTITDGTLSMGREMFTGCTSLEELTIPFAGAENTDDTGEDNADTVSDLFIYYSWDKDYSDYSIRKITVTGGCKIPEYAFSHMTTLEEINIYNSDITQIDPNAFRNCTSLKRIDIPENITEIKYNAFMNTNADICIYNSSCSLADNIVSPDYSGTISGYEGSEAADFADSHGYKFKALEKELVKGVQNISMFPGNEYTVKSDYSDISFSSSAADTATVNKKGTITALKPGTAVISVKSDTGEICSINVIVKAPVKETTTAVTSAAEISSSADTTAVTLPATTTVPETAPVVTTTSTAATSAGSPVTSALSETEAESTTSKAQTSETSKPVITSTTTKTSDIPQTVSSTAPVTTTSQTVSSEAPVTTTPPTVSWVNSRTTTPRTTVSDVPETTTTASESTENTDPVPPKPHRLNIDGEMKVSEMTPEQIKQANIDLSDLSNYHIFKYETRLKFDTQVMVINKYRNGIGGRNPNGAEKSEEKSGIDLILPEVFINGKQKNVLSYYETPTEEMYMIINGECKWLKEFYDVELIVINKDTENESLTNCSATINIPDGLTPVNCDVTQDLGVLAAGQAFETHWYLRGEKAGDYNDLESVFTGYNHGEKFSYKFKTENSLHVYADNALKMEINVPGYSSFDDYYLVKISFKNVSDKPIYNIEHTINNCCQVSKLTVSKYHNGILINEDKPEEVLQSKDINYTIHLGELDPGDEIIADISIRDIWKSIVEKEIENQKVAADVITFMTCYGNNPYLMGANFLSSYYRTILDSFVVEHVLECVDVATLPGSTTQIPYEVVITDNYSEISDKYSTYSLEPVSEFLIDTCLDRFNASTSVKNISKTLFLLTNEIYKPDIADDPMTYAHFVASCLPDSGITDNMMTLQEDAYYRVYIPEGEINVDLYILKADSNFMFAPKSGVPAQTDSVYDNFDIEVIDGVYTVDKNGKYVFESDALVKVTPKKAGIRAIICTAAEDGSVKDSVTVEVVDKHECRGKYTILSSPSEESGAVMVSFCETCHKLIDCTELPKEATAMLDNGESYQDIRGALEDAAKSDEKHELYIFGNVNIPENITVPENLTLIIVPDTKLCVTDGSKFIVKGEVKDFSGYDYNFENGCPGQKASETEISSEDTSVTETTVTETPSSNDKDIPSDTSAEISDNTEESDSAFSAIIELAMSAFSFIKNFFAGFFG